MCIYNEKEAKMYNSCYASCNAKSKGNHAQTVGSAAMSSVKCICNAGPNKPIATSRPHSKRLTYWNTNETSVCSISARKMSSCNFLSSVLG